MPKDKRELPTIADKRAELTEAMKGDMERRAKTAQEEIAEILKKHNCVIMAVPKFEHLQNGVFAVACDPLVRALDPR